MSYEVRRTRRACMLMAAAAIATPHQVLHAAGTIELSVKLDEESRFFEYLSDTFAQLNQPWPDENNPELDCGSNQAPCDGWFLFRVWRDTGVYQQIGGGDRIFQRGEDLRLGVLEFDSALLTGVGIESTPVTGLVQVDIAADVGGDDLPSESSGPYTTTITPGTLAGTVTFEDGELLSLDFDAEIVFSVPDVPFGFLAFDATLEVTNNTMTLVGGPETIAVSTRQVGWDLLGEVYSLPGDYDDNGVVDAADYTIYRDALEAGGGPLDATWTSADGNGDGLVDPTDYTVWRNNFGRTAFSAASAIPEPGTLVAALAVCLGSLAQHPRRTKR